MIVDMVRGDIFQSSHRAVAFAINTEGYNDAGFAGLVSHRYWPELAMIGPQPLGVVLTKEVDGLILCALVCHSLGEHGWERTPQTVTTCLDDLAFTDDEVVATVLMGSGLIGQMGGADVYAILGGIARSKHRAAVFTLG